MSGLGQNSPKHLRVFISYSHDSPEHRRRARALADQLRTDGIESWIDQYVQDPNEGWIRWMRQQVKQADKVLLIFTEAYQRRFEGDEKEGKGLGATFEGVIVTQALYEGGGSNAKFVIASTPQSTIKTCFGGCIRRPRSLRQQLVRSRTFQQNQHLNCFHASRLSGSKTTER